VLLAGRGAIAAPSRRKGGVGSLMPIADTVRCYIVHSDELASAFLELESTLLSLPPPNRVFCHQNTPHLARQMTADLS